MNAEFVQAIDMLEKEKGISKDVIFEAVESALISAYKKNYGTDGDIEVRIDRQTGEMIVVTKLTVVDPDEIEDEGREITLEDAQDIDPEYEIGDVVEFEVRPSDFGRIAAQTAKQVVIQRIREAERGVVYDDYIERVGDVITGKVQRKSGETLFVNLGRTEGIVPVKEQVPGEHYNVNDRIRAYVMDVKNSTKGAQVFLSRSHPGLVKRLFELEVPEIEDGTVEIKSIAREAGSRTKMAVWTEYEDVDPVGACVGTRGSRVQSVVDELSNEKIDIIVWSDDPVELISNALSPAKVEDVLLSEDENYALVIVPDYQLSLAIGKAGQNVRLAAKVSGWKIDIKSHSQYYTEDEELADDDVLDDEVPAGDEVEEAYAEEDDVYADDLPEEDAFEEDSSEEGSDEEAYDEEAGTEAEPADDEAAEDEADPEEPSEAEEMPSDTVEDAAPEASSELQEEGAAEGEED